MSFGTPSELRELHVDEAAIGSAITAARSVGDAFGRGASAIAAIDTSSFIGPTGERFRRAVAPYLDELARAGRVMHAAADQLQAYQPKAVAARDEIARLRAEYERLEADHDAAVRAYRRDLDAGDGLLVLLDEPVAPTWQLRQIVDQAAEVLRSLRVSSDAMATQFDLLAGYAARAAAEAARPFWDRLPGFVDQRIEWVLGRIPMPLLLAVAQLSGGPANVQQLAAAELMARMVDIDTMPRLTHPWEPETYRHMKVIEFESGASGTLGVGLEGSGVRRIVVAETTDGQFVVTVQQLVRGGATVGLEEAVWVDVGAGDLSVTGGVNLGAAGGGTLAGAQTWRLASRGDVDELVALLSMPLLPLTLPPPESRTVDVGTYSSGDAGAGLVGSFDDEALGQLVRAEAGLDRRGGVTWWADGSTSMSLALEGTFDISATVPPTPGTLDLTTRVAETSLEGTVQLELFPGDPPHLQIVATGVRGETALRSSTWIELDTPELQEQGALAITGNAAGWVQAQIGEAGHHWTTTRYVVDDTRVGGTFSLGVGATVEVRDRDLTMVP